MAEDQKKLQELSDTYQKLQADLQTTITARQRLESQQQENKRVQNEFSLLPSSTPTPKIYKLIGPVLLPQETAEANQAVDARLTYIEREIKRLEGTIREKQAESERVKVEVMRVQQELQLQQGQQ